MVAVACVPALESPVRFGTISGCCLLRSNWGDFVSVFNPLSGDTHLLSALPAEVISLLGTGPLSLDQLCGLLAQRCEVQDASPWRAKIAAILDDLTAIDLVEVAVR